MKYTSAFNLHKLRAKRYSIPFLLTFEEWLKIWEDSGHLHERGRCKGQYCMARFGDKGPYAIGNVKIITVEENHREATMSPEGRKRVSAVMKLQRNMLGRKHKPETIEKMRIKALARPKPSKESVEKMAATKRGKKASAKTVEKRRIALIEHYKDPAARAVLSAAQKKAWVTRKERLLLLKAQTDPSGSDGIFH